MRRAAIYARFSTDLQNERSIDDQATLCRKYAAQEGLNVVATFDDRARSGGSILGRDGLFQLMEQARAGAFEVILVEALDRLSRDMEDLAGIYKRLSFLGVEIRAVHEGVVNTVLVGLRGLVGQLYREDNAHKVRRGQAGRVNHGLNPGGLTYGYAPVPGERGKRAIVAAEAEIVLRVFREYADGRTPRGIAYELNRERVRPPRGRTWNASTINGNSQRGTGLLHNELYAGRLVWNKVRMVKNPDTGRRVSRPNPKSDWQSVEVPDLAIVPPDLFDAVQALKAARAKTLPHEQRRPRHMLSGLLRCGACGAGMSANGSDKTGRTRIRCSAATESGTCPDPKTFYLDAVEKAVLNGLTAEMRQPDVIAEYVRTYQEERQRLAADADARRHKLEREVGRLSRELERVIDAIAEGRGNPAVLGPRSTAIYHERNRLAAELEAAPPSAEFVGLHPAALARYEEQLGRLSEALAKGIQAGDVESAEALRDLIEKVTVFRASPPGGVEIEIEGRLTALLGEKAYPNRVRGVWGSMVAEARFELATFGL